MTLTEQVPAENRSENVGRIESIQGVVIDAYFPDKLPEINHAIRVRRPRAEAAE
jgi:F-type H+/Na+-transporting ATPase subunit beta